MWPIISLKGPDVKYKDMKKVIAIGIIVFEAYLIISLSRSVFDLWHKQEAISDTRGSVDKLTGENARLKSRRTYVQSDAFVEKEAREKLNLVKPGEAIVVIPDSILKAATASAAPTPVPPNWQQWLRLFF